MRQFCKWPAFLKLSNTDREDPGRVFTVDTSAEDWARADVSRSWCRVWGLGFRVSFFVFFRIPGFGFRVLGFGFRVSGFGFQVSGFGFRVSGFGFRVSGFVFRFSGF